MLLYVVLCRLASVASWVEGVIGLVTYVVRSHGQWGREYRHRDRETAQMIPPRHVEMEGINVDQVTIVCYRVAQQSVRSQSPRGRLAREQRSTEAARTGDWDTRIR